jgi:hypothetical protein
MMLLNQLSGDRGGVGLRGLGCGAQSLAVGFHPGAQILKGGLRLLEDCSDVCLLGLGQIKRCEGPPQKPQASPRLVYKPLQIKHLMYLHLCGETWARQRAGVAGRPVSRCDVSGRQRQDFDANAS